MFNERDEQLIDAYLDGELLPEDRLAFECRLEQEPELSRALERSAAVRSAMADLRQPAPGALVEDVMAAVEEEIVERAPRRAALWSLPLEGVAAAAVILLALAAGSHFYRHDRIVPPPLFRAEPEFQTALAAPREGGGDRRAGSFTIARDEMKSGETVGVMDGLLAAADESGALEEELLIASAPVEGGAAGLAQAHTVPALPAGVEADAAPHPRVFARTVPPGAPPSSTVAPAPEAAGGTRNNYDLRSSGETTAQQPGFLALTAENAAATGDETAPIEYTVIVSFVLPKDQVENLRTLARQVGGAFVLSEPEEGGDSDGSLRAGFTYPFARQDQVRRKLAQMNAREIRMMQWEIQTPPRRIYVEVLFE